MHGDTLDLIGNVAADRRSFLVTKLAAGFALAVQPITAQTITTDTSGLTAGEIELPVKGGKIPAYQAMPAQGGPFPVVLVVQEIFGVHEHIKDVCRRFAKLGHFAIAPELYARQGDVSGLKDIAEIRKVVVQVPDAQVMADLDAAVAYTEKSGKGNTGKLGVTGFCWGGRIVWLYAAHQPKLKAGGAWYGRLLGNAPDLQPKNPIDVVGDLKAPVLGLYGEQDEGVPVASVEKMREALKAAGKTQSRIDLYPAPHGFNADYRPSYRADHAQAAWKSLLGFFRQHGAV